MEHVANPELLVPLPLSNVTHSDLAGQYPSSALVLTDATQSDQLATPPPVNFASQKNEKIQRFSQKNISRPPVLKKFHGEKKGRTLMIRRLPAKPKKSRCKVAIFSGES